MRELPWPPHVCDRGSMRTTRSWSEIAERYRGVPSFEPMVQLVEHIAAAPYAGKIFGDTSMWTLVIAQTPEIRQHQEIIRVEYSEAGFEVALQERGFGLALRPDDPVRRVPAEDGIGAFERLLRAKRWD